MKFATGLVALSLAFILAGNAQSADFPRFLRGGEPIYGGNAELNKAAGDTINLMGPATSGAPYIGDFESGWNGWTSVDVTAPTISHWQVSDYNQAVPGNLAAWCGDISFASCADPLDEVGGYGNSWRELLGFRAAVSNSGADAMVNVTATLQNDNESGYDYTYLSVKVDGVLGYTDIQTWTGEQVVNVNESFTVLPAELGDGTDVHILWRMNSDGAWSDEDCLSPSAGACQIDDITVTISQVGESDIVSFTDFQNGTLGDWEIEYPTGVGNFAKLWTGLEDNDPCRTNYSQQVAFVDDGVVVPGTGGADCLNWCYGPAGYIVNTTGGLAGPSSHIQVAVSSPVMTWPNAAYEGIIFAFDLYEHEELDADSPGIFWEWKVRSADTDGSAGPVEVLADQPWVERIFRTFPGPNYSRKTNNVTTLMHPGRDEIQVQVGVYELGWVFGYSGNDGYPAPYFDNIAVKVFPFQGPSMSTREYELAQDGFPEIDVLPTAGSAVADAAALATMHVRFDAAQNISPASHLRNDPGDSLTVQIVPVRTGSVLTTPQMHYVIDANPVFAAARAGGFSTSGTFAGSPAIVDGLPSPDIWAFDLPDTGYLYPGDVMHYYFRAGDDAGGGDVLYSTLPEDISGFGDFVSGPLAYDSSFTMRALPRIRSLGGGDSDKYTHPNILFWNDQANQGSEVEWHAELSQLGFRFDQDYDTYYTNAPSSGVGNGIGGRTNGSALVGYEGILYTAGALGANTISNGDFTGDAGNDIAALNTWLSNGEKKMYMTGDSIASDVALNEGGVGQSFMENVMGLDLLHKDVRGFINNQSTPLVLTIAGSSVDFSLDSWVAYGGCEFINTFDAVTVRPGAERLAEFANQNGNGGSYSFSALTLNDHNVTNRIITQPYDYRFTYANPDAEYIGSWNGRVALLKDILLYLGFYQGIGHSDLPTAARFSASNYPNPFNPATKISYTIKSPGHLSLKVYNVRGELVKTLVAGNVITDGFEMWDGTNDQGSEVSSGIYFYEARMGNDVEVNKMALVK